MPRIELLDATTAPPAAQPYFVDGDPGSIVAALAAVPELLGPMLDFVGRAHDEGLAGVRPKLFAMLRTSVLQGCRYGIGTYTAVALDGGLSVEEVRALRGETPVEAGFRDDADRALIVWIDALAGATGPVLDDMYLAVREHLAANVLIELSVAIGATMLLNRFATGFDLPTSADALARLDACGLA